MTFKSTVQKGTSGLGTLLRPDIVCREIYKTQMRQSLSLQHKTLGRVGRQKYPNRTHNSKLKQLSKQNQRNQAE